MTDLEKRIGRFFKACSAADECLHTVGMQETYHALKDVKQFSKDVFIRMEDHVNSTMVKDFKGVIDDRIILTKILYVLLRSIYVCGKQDNHFFDSDLRCKDTFDLAQAVFIEANVEQKLEKMPTWMKNDELYKSILYGLFQVHKTLLQSIVRCIINSLSLEEYSRQTSREYLLGFEKVVGYYINGAPAGRRITLHFV